MIIIAPITQIFVSTLRIYDKTKISLSAIGILTASFGIFLSFQATSIVGYPINNKNIKCGELSMAFLIVGSMIAIIATPIIGIISFLIYRYKHSSLKQSRQLKNQ